MTFDDRTILTVGRLPWLCNINMGFAFPRSHGLFLCHSVLVLCRSISEVPCCCPMIYSC